MPSNPPGDTPRVSPYLYYEDVARALQWLARTFGFRERMRMAGPDGAVRHAEMELGGGVIMPAGRDRTTGAPSGSAT